MHDLPLLWVAYKDAEKQKMLDKARPELQVALKSLQVGAATTDLNGCR